MAASPGNVRKEKINGVCIAIDISAEPLKGSSGIVYPAYPIDCESKSYTDINLMAKIIQYKDNPSFTPAQIWKYAEIEAKNDSIFFSSYAEKIEGGVIILMSKVLGISILDLIVEPTFNNVTPIQRIHLAMNAIVALELLHSKNIFPTDLTGGNTLIHLPSLGVTFIDLGYSHETELAKAPENKITPQSNLYSIAIDILIPIFSGIRAQKKKSGEITNFDEINEKIMLLFLGNNTTMSVAFTLLTNIFSLIKKTCSDNPLDRGTLQDVKKVLEQSASLAEEKAPFALNAAEQSNYEKQLRILEDKVFNSPMFNEKIAEKRKDEEKGIQGNSNNFFQRVTLSTPVASETTAPKRKDEEKGILGGNWNNFFQRFTLSAPVESETTAPKRKDEEKGILGGNWNNFFKRFTLSTPVASETTAPAIHVS